MEGENYTEPNYDEQDAEIDEEFGLEDNKEKNEEVYEDPSPMYGQKDDLYSLFWKVINKNDSSKIGNLTKGEIGDLGITVRDCQRIALLATSFGKPGVAKFFTKQGEITLSTSSSRDGSLINLFVSQHKFSTKEKKVDNSANFQKSRNKGLFNIKK